jgi:hypothetical protein
LKLHKKNEWYDYNDWNKRNQDLSRWGVEGFQEWINKNILTKKQICVLDYGCSYFDLGIGLTDKFKCFDGFDIDVTAIAIAQERMRSKSNVSLYHDEESIPKSLYNIIFVSSVVQYFGEINNVITFLKVSRENLLKNGLGKIIITDLIPKNYNEYYDAIENLLLAFKNKLFIPMFVHILKAATQKFIMSDSELNLLRINPNTLKRISIENGFSFQIIKNIGISDRRYSAILTAVQNR